MPCLFLKLKANEKYIKVVKAAKCITVTIIKVTDTNIPLLQNVQFQLIFDDILGNKRKT